VSQNVEYAEVTFTPASHGVSRRIPFDTYFSGMTRGRERVQESLGVEMNWVFDMTYFPANLELSRRIAAYTLDSALNGKADGVVGLGLGGIEIGHSLEHLAPYFRRARSAGLHSVPHAGETLGPKSIWGAITILGAERIGHGVRAIEDASLVRYLTEHRIPLEVCPTSNIKLGVYPNLNAHPLRDLYEAGVIVTVNSDDPALFNTTLNREFELLHERFGFGVPAIDDILLNGFRHSFMDPVRKRQRLQRVRDILGHLREDVVDGV